jgi:hypothetical protein
MIVNPGCVGIYDYLLMHKMKAKPLLNNDDKLTTVWTTDNYVEGVMIFERKKLLEEYGMFDKLFDKSGFEQIQFTLKFAFQGMNNFYIRCNSTTSIKIPEREGLFIAKTKMGSELINSFIKANMGFHETV